MPTLNPSPAGFQFSATKNTKTPPGAGASILPLVVIGHCSNTVDAPIATPVPIATPDAAQAAGTTGPAVELAACALDDNGQVDLVHLVNSGASNAATYGAITQTWAHASPPVAAADSVLLPQDDFDVAILWTAGGFAIGTAGNKYRISLDNGLHYFAEQALGTATSITLPNGAGKINLDPPTAALAAYVDDLRLMTIDHFAETGSSIHGSADATSGAGIPGTTVSTLALARTCMIALKAAALLHVVNVSGSPAIHGAADTTAQTALNAISISSSSTGQEVLTAALAYADAMFGDGATTNDAHNLRTASSIHGAADTTNVLTATIPTRGTITTNDTVVFSTNSPTPDATELVAAIDSLRAYTGQLGTITFASPLPAGYIAAVYAALKELWKYNKFADVVASFDRPGLTESTTAYATRLEALDSIVAVDFRMCGGATYHQSALILTADGAATPRRPTSWWVSMTKARNEPQTDLQFVAPQQGVRIRDSRGRLLPGCLDEQSGLLYSVLRRTIGTRTDPTRDSNGGVFVTQDLVLYDSNSDWILGPYTSVVNHALRTAAPVVVNASAAPDGFPGFDQEVIDGLVADVLAVVEPEIVGKRRAKEVRFSITDTSGGKLKWKMVVIPNDYVINGVELESSVVLTAEV